MRGAPQSGLSALICAISALSSAPIWGRPPRLRDLQRQELRNPARCHRMSVSGRMIWRTPIIDGNQRYSWTKTRRSLLVSRALPRHVRPSTISCWRRTAFSASSRAVDLNGETKRAKANHRSPITRSAYAIRPPPQWNEVFGTHSPRQRTTAVVRSTEVSLNGSTPQRSPSRGPDQSRHSLSKWYRGSRGLLWMLSLMRRVGCPIQHEPL